MAPSKIVQTRGGWPFFEVDVTSAKANPPDARRWCPPEPTPAAAALAAADPVAERPRP
jgi:hypothetical protein